MSSGSASGRLMSVGARFSFAPALILGLLAVWPAGSQPGMTADVPALPPGLATVWRSVGRRLDARASAWSFAAFSHDAEFLGVTDESGTRLHRVGDGRVERVIPVPLAMGQSAFGLAVSSQGAVAVGRVGGVDVYDFASRAQPATYHCRGVCGPVTALAFSPDGARLAYQASRGALDPTPGAVHLVDLRARARIVELEASTTRTGVWFSGDGRALVAANVTRIEETGTFGVRTWSAGPVWRPTRDVRGMLMPLGSIGPFAFTERVAAYSLDGHIELRELASGAVLWSVPFAPPALDAGTGVMATRLDHVALAPRADLMLSYESPETVADPGTLVLRRIRDGEAIALYDVAHLNALALAPNGTAFAFTTGRGRTYTLLARVPL